jgi:hypothetical protein
MDPYPTNECGESGKACCHSITRYHISMPNLTNGYLKYNKIEPLNSTYNLDYFRVCPSPSLIVLSFNIVGSYQHYAQEQGWRKHKTYKEIPY